MLKGGLSPTPKRFFCLLQLKLFKNDEKCFFFYLKSSFHSRDIWIFVSTFWSCRKNDLVRKIDYFQNLWGHKLVRKQLQCTSFPISHEVKVTRQRSLLHCVNVIRDIFFYINHSENDTGRLVPDSFLFFEKTLCKVKATRSFKISWEVLQDS